MEWQKVLSIEHLKTLCDINGRAEFYIILAEGLCRSGKEIHYDNQSGKFEIYHEIDETWQSNISEKELYTETNIPDAIENSSMYFCGYQLWGI